jgi:hypothetical protein
LQRKRLPAEGGNPRLTGRFGKGPVDHETRVVGKMSGQRVQGHEIITTLPVRQVVALRRKADAFKVTP